MSDPVILCVDDSSTSLSFLRAALSREEITVRTATSADEGLELARLETVDFFILDVHLEEMSGFQLLERLRHLPGHSHTPALFLTASNSADLAGQAESAGADLMLKRDFILLASRLRERFRPPVQTA